jgi:hypothetical protein
VSHLKQKGKGIVNAVKIFRRKCRGIDIKVTRHVIFIIHRNSVVADIFNSKTFIFSYSSSYVFAKKFATTSRSIEAGKSKIPSFFMGIKCLYLTREEVSI